MIADRELRRRKCKTVPIIRRTLCLMDVGTILISHRIARKSIVDKQLHLDVHPGIRLVNRPSCNRRVVSLIQHAAQIGIGRCEIETDSDRRNKQSFGHRL